MMMRVRGEAYGDADEDHSGVEWDWLERKLEGRDEQRWAYWMLLSI